MARYPAGYRSKDAPILGVLSGWNKVTTNKADELPIKTDHGFTIPDLLRIVRILKDEFSPEKISSIEEMIEKHIARQDNPHHVDLPQLNTSVLQELYKLWLEKGYLGTEDDFLRVIFQYIKVADIDTTREGKVYDEVVHSLGLKTVVEDHDLDPRAHDRLMARIFPGSPVTRPPAYAIDAFIGNTYDMKVSRASSLWILNANGVIEKLGNNELKADYSTGYPAFPIFAANTNLIKESENFKNTTYWTVSEARIETSSTIYSPKNSAEGCSLLIESTSATAKLHALTYKDTSITKLRDNWYTISAMVTPAGRSCVGIKITSESEDRFPWVHFDLEREDVFTEDFADHIFGKIYPLYNNWYRIQVTFRAETDGKLTFQIYPLDIYDGDAVYEGLGDRGIGLYGVTVSSTAYLIPYIPSSNGTCGTIAPTILKIPTNTWYNKAAGTVVICCTNVGVDTKLTQSSTIFEVGSPDSVAMSAIIPVGNNNRFFMANYNNRNVTIASKWTQASTKTWAFIMQGHANLRHVFGGTEGDASYVASTTTTNQNVSYLYLGCSRHGTGQLNGFIRTFTYYPELLEPNNMPFFTGRALGEEDFE